MPREGKTCSKVGMGFACLCVVIIEVMFSETTGYTRNHYGNIDIIASPHVSLNIRMYHFRKRRGKYTFRVFFDLGSCCLS